MPGNSTGFNKHDGAQNTAAGEGPDWTAAGKGQMSFRNLEKEVRHGAKDTGGGSNRMEQ